MNENKDENISKNAFEVNYLINLNNFLDKFAIYILFLALINYPNTYILLLLTWISIYTKNCSKSTKEKIESLTKQNEIRE